MTDSPFAGLEETIFDNKDVLNEEYQPETIHERDKEIDAMKAALKDVYFGNSPSNIFVFGKTGVGKTAITKYMTNTLQEEVSKKEDVRDLEVYYHNCNEDTVFDVIRTLVNTLRDPTDEKFPERGLSTSLAMSELFDLMEAKQKTFLFILDEIDHLSGVDTLLYELPRARSNGNLEDSYVGVIGITNNLSFPDTLSPKVKGTLMEHKIKFTPYDADELTTILKHRAEKAFRDDALESGVIELCAALAAKDTGSARQALDLLRSAGNITENRGKEKITSEVIHEARDAVEEERIIEDIRTLTSHGKYVLYAVATLHKNGEAPIRSTGIKNTYDRQMHSRSIDPLQTLRSIQDHLLELTMLGFIDREENNMGRNGGSYYLYQCSDSIDPEYIISAIEEEEGDT